MYIHFLLVNYLCIGQLHNEVKFTSRKSTRLKIHNKQPREMLIRKPLMIINPYR